MPLVMAPVMKTFIPPLRSARSRISATVPALSMGGDVFGMQTSEVKPPRAAAAVPVMMVSLAVWPGSRKCTCRSISPGQTTCPLASNLSVSAGACCAASGPSAAILPCTISKSVTVSKRLAGSMTRPPMSNSEFMRAGGYTDPN